MLVKYFLNILYLLKYQIDSNSILIITKKKQDKNTNITLEVV